MGSFLLFVDDLAEVVGFLSQGPVWQKGKRKEARWLAWYMVTIR